MAETGFTLVGAGANDADSGAREWSNPGNITADDTNEAAAEGLGSNMESVYLVGTNLGLSVPAGATITGVELRARRYASNTNVVDEEIRLVIGGSPSGDDKSAGTSLGTSANTVTFGGASDLWGLAEITPAEVNASNFGGAFRVIRVGGGPSQTANYEAMWLNVHYEEPSVSGPYVRHNGVWKQSEALVRDGGAWKPAEAFVREGGVWKAMTS